MYRSESRHSFSVVARRAHLPASAIALAALVWLGACGDPQPPVACGSIPQQTLHAGEREVVTPCFEDPEMEPISLSAASSNSEVADASISGSAVQIRGVSPGNATVTVTATDPDSLTAQVRFDVLVPNRAPEVIRTMPEVRLPPGGSGGILLSLFFDDPDAQTLSYQAESSNLGVMTVSVTGDTLIMAAGELGTATGTATATDPGGLSTSQTFTMTVLEPYRLLRDDFETEASLDNWILSDDSEASVEDGRFWLENTNAQALGFASANLFATEWRVTASLGNATRDAWAALVVLADHERFPAYLIQIGADGNSFGWGETDYRFLVRDQQQGLWATSEEWIGQSDVIGDVGELTTISMAIEDGLLTVTAGAKELLRIELAGTVLSGTATLAILASWPSGETTGRRVFFDWVEVTGIALGDVETDMRLKRRLEDLLRPFHEIGSWDQIRRVEGGLKGPVERTPFGDLPRTTKRPER